MSEGVALKGRHRIAIRVMNATVGVTTAVNNVYVGDGFSFVVPGLSILRGFLVSVGAPGGTGEGNKAIDYAIGTEQNADADLLDPTDIDVMLAATEQTGASVHGDAAGDHESDYFPMDCFGAYLADDTPLWFNFLGKSSAGGDVVSAAVKVWALLDYLT